MIDFNFIYELVEDTYSTDNGRPSLDPVMLVKIPLIQCLYGIRSMRQTIKEIEVNMAYRWFLGLTLDDRVPHFTTYGKNYSRRFQEKELISEIFSRILNQALRAGLIDPSEIFVDGTHITFLFVEPRFRYPFLSPLPRDSQAWESLLGSPVAGAHGGLAPQMYDMPVVLKKE
ncbi:transposase [Streptococcus varani]|uniref:Transposase n=1 Tax=Streptococcus varani TaxID=1608583 RepID=A0A0E4H5A6_9STRE|nr:transposase [Streptococcus varani]